VILLETTIGSCYVDILEANLLEVTHWVAKNKVMGQESAQI